LPVASDVLGVAVTMLGFDRARNGPGHETRWNPRVQSKAFEFEYNWSQPISAAVYSGSSFFLRSRFPVCTVPQCGYYLVHVVPSPMTKSFWHPTIFADDKLLTYLTYGTSLCVLSQGRVVTEYFPCTQLFQNRYLNSASFYRKTTDLACIQD
jgi:hypothetical protein